MMLGYMVLGGRVFPFLSSPRDYWFRSMKFRLGYSDMKFRLGKACNLSRN